MRGASSPGNLGEIRCSGPSLTWDPPPPPGLLQAEGGPALRGQAAFLGEYRATPWGRGGVQAPGLL